MEVQQEGPVGEHRGPPERSSVERRIGNGRRVCNRRIDEVPVEDEQRAAVRRMGPIRRGGAVRRERDWVAVFGSRADVFEGGR